VLLNKKIEQRTQELLDLQPAPVLSKNSQLIASRRAAAQLAPDGGQKGTGQAQSVERLYNTNLEKNNNNLQKQREKLLLSASGHEFTPSINYRSSQILRRKASRSTSRYPMKNTGSQSSEDSSNFISNVDADNLDSQRLNKLVKKSLAQESKSKSSRSRQKRAIDHVQALHNWDKAKKAKHDEVRDHYYKSAIDQERRMSCNSSVDDIKQLPKKVLAQTLNTPKICKKSITIVLSSSKN